MTDNLYFLSFFRVGLDSCLLYATLESMLAQICFRGDVNIASYSRHLSTVHGLTLTSADLYVYLHDLLAEAADCGHLHSVLQSDATMNSNGSLSIPQ
jgi:7-keto-8-aminopelargonate synthetase-like enzyme